MRLALKQMIVMAGTDLFHNFGESIFSQSKERAAAMSSKTEIVVKLVSPCQTLVWCEEHEGRLRFGLLQRKFWTMLTVAHRT